MKRVWRVRVQCIQEPDARGLCPTCYEDCLVEASDSVEAMEAGHAFIECKAPSDVRWGSFEAVRVESVDLPMAIG